MLDERLSLAAALYEPCELGADIGTDHGLLPCHLLRSGVCRRMILADVSDNALDRARAQVSRQKLGDRAELICADGLDALTQPCGCVSVTGMGGETLAGILRRGQSRLQGAVLILSAHTDLPLVRAAIRDIGYHIVREILCRAAGRFYVVWRAEPGEAPLSDDALRLGEMLTGDEALLKEYALWRVRVLESKLSGLRSAQEPDESAIAQVVHDIEFYRRRC